MRLLRKFQKLRKKQLEIQLRERAYERDDDGRILVNMTVRDDQDFLSAFSANDVAVISDNVAEYLEYWTENLSPDESLTLCIHSCCIDSQEEALYRRAIQEYYTQDYIANERELKKNRWLVAGLSVVGILVLFGMVLFDYYVGRPVWTEVIDIVAWVLLWEAVDIGLLENRHLKEKRWRYLSYIDMNVEYVCADTDEN